MAGSEPNAENKLFVGGCPPGSGEEDLRKIFEEHGEVEEVFIMRGGSRSGMACAFVRFLTQEMAQKAIDTIHGQITLPNAAEPLVVRWADAPGSRRRDTREKSSKRSGSGNGRDGSGIPVGRPMYGYGGMEYQQQQGWGVHMGYMQMPMQGYNGFYGQGQMGGGYGGMNYAPNQQPLQMHMMPGMPYQQQMTPMMMQQAANMMAHMPNSPQMPPYAFEQNAMPTMSATEHAH